MKRNEQGVLRANKLLHLFSYTLLIVAFFITHPASAATSPGDTAPHKKHTQKHHVFIVHSADNTLHSNIIHKLSENLKLKRSDIVISKTTPEKIIKTVDSDTDLIIGIGQAGIQSADKHYPKTNKLFISTDPNKYRLDKNKNKDDAILYMTQSYCRQIRLIKLLNQNWKTIGILDSQNKPVDRKVIRQCANKHGIKTYIVSITNEENLTNKIKHALHHSDVLLALPNSNIYNSNTVKNILLTSYRYRKPVIAFSKNFVSAGALAAIYSDTDQIALAAGKLIEQYFDSGARFKSSANHPDTFDLNINRQVFKALDLAIPDTDWLRQSLEKPEQNRSGNRQ